MRHPSLRFTPVLLLLSPGLLAPRGAEAAEPCASGSVIYNATSNNLYVAGAVSCTLTDLHALAPDAPLSQVGTATWFLGANLLLQEGATLVLDGTARGGDVDELRLRSDSTYVEVIAIWGNIFIRGTKVTSWDEGDGGPNTNPDRPRAFLRAVSYLDGDTPRESRMDVIDSEIAYLGWYDGESYGLVWKVRGTQSGLYDLVDVYGDVTNSHIHHNYFGFYSYGAYGMNIVGNEVHDNVMYGIDPHDDSDSLLVAENDIYNNGNHGFICSMRCDNLVVRDNYSHDNGLAGYMFHRDVQNSVFENNLAEDNGDAGFAIMDSHNNVIRDNVARRNKYGLRFSVGASDNLAENNELTDNGLYGIYMYQGTDAPTINDGRPARNVLVGNVVSNSVEYGIKASDAVDNQYVENVLESSGIAAAFLMDNDGTVFQGNDLAGSYLHLKGSPTFVRDSDQFKLLIENGSDVTVTDSTGHVLANDVGMRTAIAADGSLVSLGANSEGTLVAVDALELAILPSAGELEVDVLSWSESARAWRTFPGTATDAEVTVGGLAPGARQFLFVDGVRVDTLVADANGEVSFSADVGDAEHTFALKSARWGGLGDWKVPSPKPSPILVR